jgi:hypothetical protein
MASFEPFAGAVIWSCRPDARTSRLRDNGYGTRDGIGYGNIGRCDYGRPWMLAVTPAMKYREMVHGVAEFLGAYDRV